jgi:hypothetical protein
MTYLAVLLLDFELAGRLGIEFRLSFFIKSAARFMATTSTGRVVVTK